MALERPHPIFSKLRATFGTKLYFLLALLVEQNSRDRLFTRHLGTLASQELRNGDNFLRGNLPDHLLGSAIQHRHNGRVELSVDRNL